MGDEMADNTPVKPRSPETILVLGAGRGQVGLIKAAKALGVRTAVATLPSDTAPGIPLADEVVYVDIADPIGVEEAARRLKVNAIAASCGDIALPALGKSCDALRLPGLTEQAALLCADKKLMKDAFEASQVRTARYRAVRDLEQLRYATNELGLPVIIKAVDLQGSQGIVVVRSPEELEPAFDHVIKATARDHVIIEEFIEGHEFGAQALVYQGKILFVLVHDDDVHMARTAIPVEHSVPLEDDSGLHDRATREIEKAIRAVGLDDCAVNVDLIVRDGEVFVIEITGRVGANGLGEMVSRHFGIDYYTTIAQVALGREPHGPWESDEHQGPAVIVKMIAAPSLQGRIRAIGIDYATVPDAEYFVFKKAGDQIQGFTHSGDCIGQITVSADTLERAREKLTLAEAAVSISVEE